MAKVPQPEELDYAHVLDKLDEKGPTDLMEHIVEWIKDNTGFDPDECESKEDAYAYGVYLTVALRPAHQGSPENQTRLDANKAKADAVAAEREERQAAKAQAKTARAESADEKPSTGRRGRRGAAAPTESEADTESAPNAKRRGRRDAAAGDAAAEVTPITGRRGRGKATLAAAKTGEAATTEAVTTATKEAPKRAGRRPAAKKGEAAF